MPKHLLALDLDGTCFFEPPIPERLVRQLERLRAAGCHVMICTGRQPRMAVPFARQVASPGPLVCFNGALTVDTVTSHLLWHQPLPLSAARAVSRLAHARDWPLFVYTPEAVVASSLDSHSAGYYERGGITVEVRGAAAYALAVAPTKLCLRVSPADAPAVAAAVRAALEAFPAEERPWVAQSHPELIEVGAAGVTKGTALARVASLLGFKREQVTAIGDGENDVEMLAWAGNGFAVANASEAPRRAANQVTRGAGPDGVVEVVAALLAQDA